MEGPVHKRLPLPDLLKGFAVILMIQVHVMELFAVQEILDGTTGKISLFLGGVPAAPVFMVVMGYFVAFRKPSPGDLFRRGTRLILGGMFLNLGLNAHLIYKVLFEGWGASISIWEYIFGVDILHLAGLSLIVMALFIRPSKDRILPYLFGIAAVLSLQTFVPPYSGNHVLFRYIGAFIHSEASWSYFPLVPWLAYPLAGYGVFLAEKKIKGMQWPMLYTAVILILVAAALIFTLNYSIGISHDLSAYYHHDLRFFFWAAAFIAVWSFVIHMLERSLGTTQVMKGLKWMGKHVTAVYVIQWLIIGNLATALYKTISMGPLVIWYVLILIFTGVFTWLWMRLKEKYHPKILHGDT